MRRRYGSLEEISAAVSSCTKCPLCKTRKMSVPGNGSYNAKIMFIGEAPGRSEDLRGRPFAGSAGKKLDDALKSAGLSRDEVYITNVVKCRPPKNRVPEEIERAACARYLQDEIAALKPETVCVMGNTALQSVLGKYGITENRGKITIQDGVRYYPMVHPAATIYNRKLWPVLKKDIAIANTHMLYHILQTLPYSSLFFQHTHD